MNRKEAQMASVGSKTTHFPFDLNALKQVFFLKITTDLLKTEIIKELLYIFKKI